MSDGFESRAVQKEELKSYGMAERSCSSWSIAAPLLAAGQASLASSSTLNHLSLTTTRLEN